MIAYAKAFTHQAVQDFSRVPCHARQQIRSVPLSDEHYTGSANTRTRYGRLKDLCAPLSDPASLLNFDHLVLSEPRQRFGLQAFLKFFTVFDS